MHINYLPEFDKDLKIPLKRYRNLKDDLALVEHILIIYPDERPPFSMRLDGLGSTTCITKVKKIACRALKGKGVQSGLRLIYAYFPDAQNITLVELYHKNDQATEDRERIGRKFG